MRVLVYPHDMELGGSSINAVDLAAAVREHGHHPVVVARPGPLSDRVHELGLPLVTMQVPVRPRPWPGAVRALRAAAREHRADLVHTYEFWPCLEGYFAVGASGRAAVLGTVMSMELAPFLPRSVPLTLGYADLRDEAARRQRAAVHLLPPPVDVDHDRPGASTTGLARRFGLRAGDLHVVLVSRTAVAMKQEGIERAIDAVGALAAQLPVRLVVVGGGSAFPSLLARAGAVNEALGHPAVVLTGPLADPRPAYQIADVVVGMGSSALRGMAFGKPVVVVGVDGFSLVVEPETTPLFERTGFYGVGAGRPDAAVDPLRRQLATLLGDPGRRAVLGRFGRGYVERELSLTAAARRLDRIYRQTAAAAGSAWQRLPDTASTAGRVLAHKAHDGGIVRRFRTG